MDKPRKIAYSLLATPIGNITLSATDKGICWVSFDTGENTTLELKQWGQRWLSCNQVVEGRTDLLEQGMEQLAEYFRGLRTDFSTPLDLHGTEFQKKVWNALQRIPYGEVRSYKDVAQAIGSPKAVRAVGGANNRNPLSIFIPCHRVVGSDGALVGYGGGLKIKDYLLALESVDSKK